MKIATDILCIIERADTDGRNLQIGETLDRKTYVAVNKVLEAAGGKWDRRAKAHVFEVDAEQAIEDIINTGEVVIQRDELQYFPTPEKVVRQMLDAADIEDGMSILEPSAGNGHIAKIALREFPKSSITCVEIEAGRARNLVSMGFQTYAVDFLTSPVPGGYDRVLMNPPFAKKADVLHVRKAYSMLNPGGVLVAIMAAGITFRQDKAIAQLREDILAAGGSIEELEAGSFKESGTGVNTVMVVYPKKS